MVWLSRNFALLIGGVILVPVALFVLFSWLALGQGFVQGQVVTSNIITSLITSFFVVYFACVFLAHKRLKVLGNYGFWDVVPIFYFALMFVIFASNQLMWQ